jgi:hypothetical protein
MAVNGKAKGSNFERRVSNLLSKRFEKVTGKSNSFRRNQDSGSFFGKSNVSRTETHDLDYAVFGDLVVPRNFNYSIECKNYKKPPTFQSIMKQSVAEWDKWLKQAEQDATSSQKKMLLVIKYNNVDDFVLVHDQIGDNYQLKYKHYYVYSLEQFLGQADDIFFTN